jgi:hypothetical protein
MAPYAITIDDTKVLCEFLEIKSAHQALKILPADEKQKVVTEAFKSKGRGGDNGNPYGNIFSQNEGAIPASRFESPLSKKVYSSAPDVL